MIFRHRSRSFWAHYWGNKWDNWHFRQGRCEIFDMWDLLNSYSSWISHLGHIARVSSTCDGNSLEAVWDSTRSDLGLRPWADTSSQCRAYGEVNGSNTCCIFCRGWRVSNPRLIHETGLLTCSCVIDYNWWTIGRKAFSSLKWSARGARILGAD